jgi:hypothetical protein
MNPKKWWTSKTFWLNICSLGVAAALDEPNGETMAQALAVANLLLRFFTSQPLGR